MIQIDSKLPHVGVTIFSLMTQLANAHGAINLSQGFPDFDPVPDLIKRAAYHMNAGRNQYAPMQGILELRQKIAAKVKRMYAADYDPETEITVTAGATEAIFAAITAVVQPGDEVILLEPAYDAYVPIIQLSQGIPVYVQLTPPDYSIDWDQVADQITAKTRLIILNSPHNPTGLILNQADMQSLEALMADTNILILSDEVYEHIIFDDCRHESVSRYPGLAARSFVVSSFGKTYHATGWKIGYCLAPVALSREIQRIHQYLTFAVNTPVQLAYADIIDQIDLFENLSDFYQEKRDIFLRFMQNARFKPIPCSGTYFQLMQFDEISDLSDLEFARWLTIRHGVASIPISVFYHNQTDRHVVRFCFAKKNETLEKAAEKLCKI